MSAREPDPMRECRPGGSCPVCNAGPDICGYCGDREVEDGEDRCAECRALQDEKEDES